MVPRGDVHAGMKVRSSDRKRLGRVLICDDETFVIEKKLLSRVDYIASYDDVAAVIGGEVLLSRRRRDLVSVRSNGMVGGSPATYGDEGGGGRFAF